MNKARLKAKARKKKLKMMQLRAGMFASSGLRGAGGYQTDQHLRAEVAEEDLLERMQECDSCGALSKPLLNRVIFLHDFR